MWKYEFCSGKIYHLVSQVLEFFIFSYKELMQVVKQKRKYKNK